MAHTASIARLGPQHAGTRMTLDEFTALETEPGYLYELNKGVVVVAELPSVFHAFLVQVIRDAFILHRHQHPHTVQLIGGGGESGLQLREFQSQRHPDVSVYLRPPPNDDAQPWDTWFPDIAVEIVSDSSVQRDYEDKRDEYLKAGVKLYWIVDPRTRTATLLTRRGNAWREKQIDAAGVLETELLPDFSLPLADVFRVLG